MRPDHLAGHHDLAASGRRSGRAVVGAIGNVLSLVLLVLVLLQLVRGERASPYAQLLLVAGVVWAGTYAVARRRAGRGREASSGRPHPRAG